MVKVAVAISLSKGVHRAEHLRGVRNGTNRPKRSRGRLYPILHRTPSLNYWKPLICYRILLW